jgi:hypothetical protein
MAVGRVPVEEPAAATSEGPRPELPRPAGIRYRGEQQAMRGVEAQRLSAKQAGARHHPPAGDGDPFTLPWTGRLTGIPRHRRRRPPRTAAPGDHSQHRRGGVPVVRRALPPGASAGPQRLADVPVAGPVEAVLIRRRFACAEPLCARRTFVEVTDEVPLRAGVTSRLQTARPSPTDRPAATDALRPAKACPGDHTAARVRYQDALGRRRRVLGEGPLRHVALRLPVRVEPDRPGEADAARELL